MNFERSVLVRAVPAYGCMGYFKRGIALFGAVVLVLTSVFPVFAEEKVENLVVSHVLEKDGNIFFDGEQVSLSFLLENKTNKDFDLDIDYSVTNYDGKVVLSNKIKSEVSANGSETLKIDFPQMEINTYKLLLNVTEATLGYTSKLNIDFSCLNSVPFSANSKFGVGTHFGQDVKLCDPDIAMPIAKKAGITWIRDEWYWSYVEKERGVFAPIEKQDEFVNKAVEEGINVLIILDYGNPLYDAGKPPYTDEGIAAYANYCRETVKHLKGKVTHYEIWNEYNGMVATRNNPPELYAKMLKAAYTAIKEEDPNAFVVACATSCIDYAWIERVIKEVGIEYMDAISVHPYAYPSDPESGGFEGGIESIHELAKKYGKDLPVWSTEFGWPTYKDCVTEAIGGSYVARTFIISAATHPEDKLFVYDLQNDGVSNNEREDNFGLIRNFDKTKEAVPYSAKQNYLTYAAATNQLLDAVFEKKIETSDNLCVYQFKKNDKNFLTLWSLEKQENVGIYVGVDRVKVTDYIGNAKEVKTQNGVLNIAATEYPQYIEGVFSAVSMSKPTFSILSNRVRVPLGEGTVIDINNSSNASGEYTFNLPDGWRVKGDASIKNGTSSIEIVPASEAKNGTYSVEIIPLTGGENTGTIKLELNLVPLIEVKARPVPLDVESWKKWKIELMVINNSKKDTFSGTVTLDKIEEIDNNIFKIEDLKPNETKTLDISVNTVPEAGLLGLVGSLDLNDGSKYEINRQISFLAAVKSDVTPIIDGIFNPEEWEDSMCYPITEVKEIKDYGGEEDISAKGYIKWDNENLYMAVIAKDNVHSQPNVGSGTWAGDGIQFTFDPKRIDGYGLGNWHEFGVALTDDGKTDLWRWLSIPGKAGGAFNDDINVQNKKSNVKIIRDEETKITTYEMSFPWEELLPTGDKIIAGDLFGYSILLNDSDGSGRRGWIQYMGGIGDRKAADRFGDVILVDKTGMTTAFPEEYSWVKPHYDLLKKQGVVTETATSELFAQKITASEFIQKLESSFNKNEMEVYAAVCAINLSENMTRMDMIRLTDSILLDFAMYQNSSDNSPADEFVDLDDIASDEQQAVVNLLFNGIVRGSDRTLRCSDMATHAEMIVVLSQIKNNLMF